MADTFNRSLVVLWYGFGALNTLTLVTINLKIHSNALSVLSSSVLSELNDADLQLYCFVNKGNANRLDVRYCIGVGHVH